MLLNTDKHAKGGKTGSHLVLGTLRLLLLGSGLVLLRGRRWCSIANLRRRRVSCIGTSCGSNGRLRRRWHGIALLWCSLDLLGCLTLLGHHLITVGPPRTTLLLLLLLPLHLLSRLASHLTLLTSSHHLLLLLRIHRAVEWRLRVRARRTQTIHVRPSGHVATSVHAVECRNLVRIHLIAHEVDGSVGRTAGLSAVGHRRAHAGRVHLLWTALHVAGIWRCSRSRALRRSALLERCSSSRRSTGTARPARATGTCWAPSVHVIRAAVLFLARHHEPLLVLLLKQHQLHLVVLKSVVAATGLLVCVRTTCRPDSGRPTHTVGIVKSVDRSSIGSLGNHGGSLTRRAIGVLHGLRHLLLLLLLQILSICLNCLLLDGWRLILEGSKLFSVQRCWVYAIVEKKLHGLLLRA